MALEQFRTPVSINNYDRFIEHCDKIGADTRFHLARVNGFGGSDMVELCRHAKGIAPSYTHAADIVKSKRLEYLSSRDNPGTYQGTILEKLTRAVYEKTHGFERDQKTLDSFSDYESSDLAWLKGMPDDVLTKNGTRIIPDYKRLANPSSLSAKSDKDHFTQLNHYSMIAQDLGKSAHKIAIVALDIGPEMSDTFTSFIASRADDQDINDLASMIVKINGKGCRIIEKYASISSDVCGEIASVGDTYWPMVLNGETPELILPETAKLTEESFGEASSAVKRLAAIGRLSEALEEEKATLSKLLSDIADGGRLDAEMLSTPPVKLTARANFNTKQAADYVIQSGFASSDVLLDAKKSALDSKKAISRLTELGVNLLDEGLLKAPLDAAKVKSVLSENGESLDRFTTFSHFIQASRKNASADVLASFTSEAKEAALTCIEQVSQSDELKSSLQEDAGIEKPSTAPSLSV